VRVWWAEYAVDDILQKPSSNTSIMLVLVFVELLYNVSFGMFN
jgi:hypothetical protein